MSNLEIILNHLKTHGSITKIQAVNLCYQFGLKHQLNHLIKKGYNIKTEMIKRPNRQPYAKYILVSEDN